MKIGIQGGRGSTNEEAANYFIQKNSWSEAAIAYLISSENVLRAVEAGEVDYGTFALFTSAGYLVGESLDAMGEYRFRVMDSVKMRPQHALLTSAGAGFHPSDMPRQGTIYSHPMALRMHADFLQAHFPEYALVETADTGLAAEQLANGQLPADALVIAPLQNAQIHGLQVVVSPTELPMNATYFTEILLVRGR